VDQGKGFQADATRRRFCTALLAVALGVVLLPRRAWSAAADAARWLKERVKGVPKPGRVTLTAPDLTENGAIVPLNIAVESPMTEREHVRAVYLAAEENPNPGVLSIRFSPLVAKAEVNVRIRLAKSQRILAVAEMSDGTLWSAERQIKVTIGGCG
jgi:sulfur-oxidizing protein SoxY